MPHSSQLELTASSLANELMAIDHLTDDNGDYRDLVLKYYLHYSSDLGSTVYQLLAPRDTANSNFNQYSVALIVPKECSRYLPGMWYLEPVYFTEKSDV